MGTVTIGSDTFDVFGTSAGLATYANGSAAYYATYATANVADANQVKRTHVEATRLIALMPFADAADAVPATASADVATTAPPRSSSSPTRLAFKGARRLVQTSKRPRGATKGAVVSVPFEPARPSSRWSMLA